jgi:uncharacterized phage protein (TIGR01671 family)
VREIEFRGKTLGGEWVEGSLTHLIIKYGSVDPGWYISNKAGCCFAFAIRSETLGQYTGLEDKDGRKIFEGDIVKWGHIEPYTEYEVRIAVVKFDPDITFERINGGDNDNICNKQTFHYASFAYRTNKAIEIIGNIHDTPELLKQEGL